MSAGMILIEMRRLLPLSNAHMIIVEWHLNDVARISFWHVKSKAARNALRKTLRRHWLI